MAAPPSDPPPLTTFVQADPTTFRALVQKLTGSPAAPPPARSYSGKSPQCDVTGRRRPACFKLQERRQSLRKLEIKLSSPSASKHSRLSTLVSPVSPLDLLSPGTPTSPGFSEVEEERAIAEKGFYLHPPPANAPRRGGEPELLPLFPLVSPR